MGSQATKLLEEALKLPPEARAAMAGSLLDSLDVTVDTDAEGNGNRRLLAAYKTSIHLRVVLFRGVMLAERSSVADAGPAPCSPS